MKPVQAQPRPKWADLGYSMLLDDRVASRVMDSTFFTWFSCSLLLWLSCLLCWAGPSMETEGAKVAEESIHHTKKNLMSHGHARDYVPRSVDQKRNHCHQKVWFASFGCFPLVLA